MAITHAVEEGNYVKVYDGNRQLFSKYLNRNTGDKLMGFTSSSVSIKEGNYVKTYNDKGSQISSNYVGK
ncbi:MAG: hypothetical protein IKR42_04275 [Campylobacter sp.]|nr:hypothetical protein [Campylobacter sp.]